MDSSKVLAEGSVWIIETDLTEGALADILDAVKTQSVNKAEVWKLYFEKGDTPSEAQAQRMLGKNGDIRKVVYGPAEVAEVTPTKRDVNYVP